MKAGHATVTVSLALLSLLTVGCTDRTGVSGLRVEGAWVRAVAAPEKGVVVNTAAYMRILNDGPANRLVGAGTPVAHRAELHRTVIDDAGLATMEPAGPLDVARGSAIDLAPGGLHLMLMDVRGTLSTGDTVLIVLRFESGTELEVRAEVRAF